MRRLLTAAVLTVAVLAAWASPAAAEKFGAEGYACPGTRRGAVIDRDEQRAWLCEGKRIVRWMPVTTAISQPDPGVYPIYAKDAQTRSNFGTQVSTLDRFVAFSYGKRTGARIAFHAIPRFDDGSLAQTPESLGTAEHFGDSSGCIRLLPEDAQFVWDYLAIGDQVRVLT